MAQHLIGSNLHKLDYYFPFIVFFYGILMVTVLEVAFFKKVAARLEMTLSQEFLKRKPFAWLCFFVGGLWSLQNLWL